MSHTYSSNRIHVIFSTKGRRKTISRAIQPRLWGYMAGIARNHGFEALKIGGAEDHVHALLLLPATLSLSKAVQMLKGSSSKHLNETRAAGDGFAWQEGYGAFSVSASQTAGVIEYIENQFVHHAKRNYEEEFLEFLNKYRVEYDPRFVWG
ncbi:MAG: IS200/IS605 family transposase [Terriglobales bacterium]